MRQTLWLLAIALGASPARADDFFEAKIRPVLVEQCFKCHSADAAANKKLKANLRLDTAEGLRKGGDSGSPLAEKPAQSLLLKSLKGEGAEQMPPSGKLPDAVIADFEKWVAMGAPDPRTASAKAATGIDIEKGRKHWSFQPVRKPEVPTPKPETRNPIDAFILAKLREQGLTPVPQADRRTLIRRVYFDLIGLPPTPAEVDAFVKDGSPDAYAKLVDKLLASPQHGERWARHWLDVARFSEDQAHTFQVKPKPGAHQYRDWVIRAFNDDMPFDKFARLQIAGDLVPESEGDPFTRLAGLGFNGLGAEYYGDAGAATQAAADGLDDKLDTLTRGFLALTVACARCHDHKYDPIPQKDYYALVGVYNGVKMTDAPLASAEVVKRYDDAQAKVKEQDDAIKTWLGEKVWAVVEPEVAKVEKYIAAAKTANGSTDKVSELAAKEKLNTRFLRQWVKYLSPQNSKVLPAVRDGAADFGEKLADAMKARAKPSKDQGTLIKAMFTDKAAPFFLDPKDVEKQLAKGDTDTLAGMRKELEERKKASPPMYPIAHVVKGSGQAMPVYVRGNVKRPGDIAPKGFPQVLTPAGAEQPKDFTRLELANAIASKDNPLTARVIVNRVWAQHFGRGLVTTPSNFGALGDRPSHPELLDWLAAEFVEHGWSLKWLHRQIVLSDAYRRSSEGIKANDKDADNVYLWRANRRRLEVEPWRDALLAVSGRLDSSMGGPTTNLRDAANVRRTVYAKISRHELDGLLRLFDFPDANVTADKRTLTTVPQQQLFVLNSEFMVTQAKAFASRVKLAGTDDAVRITEAYRLAYGRSPTAAEAKIGQAFLAAPTDPKDKLTKWEQYAQALLAANEFLYVD